MKLIDKWINGVTMYKLVLYSLFAIVATAFITSLTGLLGYQSLPLLGSLALTVSLSYVSHLILVRIFSSASSTESWLITALILFLIIKPPQKLADYAVIAFAVILTSTSKYIFTFARRHIFNPVAIALVVLGLLGSGEVYWWVGSKPLLPVVLTAALLIIYKIKRFDMVVPFFLVATLTYVLTRSDSGTPTELLNSLFLSGPIVFFAGFMLTEPLTSPHTKRMRIVFAVIVGLLFGLPFAFGPIFSSTELALVIGNLFAFLVSSKQHAMLSYTRFNPLGAGIYEFMFTTTTPLKFKPGQFVEWTLPHKRPDKRGDRRYFTIASAPGAKEIRLVVRIDDHHSSSFKRALLILKPGDQIWISQLAGDFVLPRDNTKKIVMVAGGVGITPFRSMIRHDLNTKTKRDVTLFHLSRTVDGFCYADLFEEASANGLKLHKMLTVKDPLGNWKGRQGGLTHEIITTETDCKNTLYYLSGPNAMVANYRRMLRKAGVPGRHIKTDYFPGF